MLGIVFVALVIFLSLAYLLARHAPPKPAALAIPAGRLRALVGELLEAMGLSSVTPRYPGDEAQLLAVRKDALREQRYVVLIDAAPYGDAVEQPTVEALAEAVKVEKAHSGLLITPYTVPREALSRVEVPVEIIDGARLRQLVAEYLPSRAAELDRYRGFARDAARDEEPLLAPPPPAGARPPAPPLPPGSTLH